MSASAAMTAGPNLSIRWAFDVSRWLPTSEEWILAMKCVKEESERARIRRFRYAQDAKASLVGALMLRRLATGPMQLSAASFRRNDRGRPCLTDARATQWDFNVSHQGSYTVLAAEGPSLYPVKGCSPVKSEPPVPVGVDVMRCSDQREDVEKFFKLMKRQFTDREWEIINAGHDNVKKMRTFYRLWCLKESFIKAKGTGLNWNLQRLNFEIHSELPSKEGAFVTDTVLYVDKLIQRDWTFQEIILDADHCVCVAVGRPNSCPPAPFTLLETMNELIDVSELISDSDSHAEFRHYQAMEAVKPF